jgi:7-cyano-7-deazaguanine synthase
MNSLRTFLAVIANPNLRPLAVLDEPVADLYRNHWSLTGANVPHADDPDESVYLPGRNLLLLAKGAILCSLSGLSVLMVGTLRGNPFPDARPEFFAGMAHSISLALGSPFEIVAPFHTACKEDVIKLADGAPLELSFSCIHPSEGRHCGQCNKCGERKRHFALAEVADQTDYAG